MADYNLYVMDKDYCPDKDAIIYRNICDNCTHYCGFQVENGERCIRCSFYNDITKNS